ncbi:MAG: ATPase, T2SS/T4P/T4SS family, partial [Thermodesulfobacteriaceae bacterium]|nr:ATPase, T2SS/T4P/T4SS family [Thermodesulfobacteriaceae bacterium]
MAKLDPFFKLMVETAASDLHLSAGNPPLLRVHGDLQRVKYKVLEDEELREMLYEVAPEEVIKRFEEEGEVDFGLEIPGLARFRVNYYKQRRGVAAAFRLIPNKIKTVEELGLPVLLNKLALLPRGLVLVTGPTGSGKSTTLAAIIDYANRTRYDHIITIEDPIEFVHESRNCLVNQRELGTHTKSFANALRAALREDPDII